MCLNLHSVFVFIIEVHIELNASHNCSRLTFRENCRWTRDLQDWCITDRTTGARFAGTHTIKYMFKKAGYLVSCMFKSCIITVCDNMGFTNIK